MLNMPTICQVDIARFFQKKKNFFLGSVKKKFSHIAYFCVFSKSSFFCVFSGGAFVPAPEVEVGVMSLTPLRQPYIQLPYETVEHVVNSLFLNGKNKYIR